MAKKMRDRDPDDERPEKHSDRKQKEKQRARETAQQREERLGRKQAPVDTTGKTDKGLENQLKETARQGTEGEAAPETQSPLPGERKTRDTDMQEQSDGLHAAARRARTDAIDEEDEGLLDDNEEFNRRLREEGAPAVVESAAAERSAQLEEARKKRDAEAKSAEE